MSKTPKGDKVKGESQQSKDVTTGGVKPEENLAMPNQQANSSLNITSTSTTKTSNDETTRLMKEALIGRLETLKLFLDHGSNVNLINNNETTPLMLAADYGDLETTLLLLEHGADVNLMNKKKETALHLASY